VQALHPSETRAAPDLDGGGDLRIVLTKDLLALGWSTDEVAARVMFETLLYSFRNIAFY